jgi:hypothetical protein
MERSGNGPLFLLYGLLPTLRSMVKIYLRSLQPDLQPTLGRQFQMVIGISVPPPKMKSATRGCSCMKPAGPITRDYGDSPPKTNGNLVEERKQTLPSLQDNQMETRRTETEENRKNGYIFYRELCHNSLRTREGKRRTLLVLQRTHTSLGDPAEE